MEKFLPIIVVVTLVLSGIGAVAVSEDTNNLYEIQKIRNIVNIDSSSLILKESTEDFIEIEFEDTSSYLMSPCKPILPKIVKTFELPFGVYDVEIELNEGNIKELDINQKIRPAPIHLPLISLENEIDINTINKKDESVYLSSEMYPSTWYKSFVRCGLNSKNERVTHLTLHIYPIRYAPALDEIFIMEKSDIIINYKIPDTSPFTIDTEYDLVIITPDKFSSLLQKLVEHKNSYGVNTFIKTTEEIYDEYEGVDYPEEIKLFIKDAIETNNITYVLLVGGLKNKILANPRENKNYGIIGWHLPVRYNNYIDDPEHPLTIAKIHDPGVITDLYYADIYKEGGEFEDWDSNDDGIIAAWNLEGYENDTIDLEPDVCVGRLACRDKTEVKNVVNKIINYETTTAGSEWFKKVITISGDGFLDQIDLDFQWDTSTLPDGEYTIFAQSENDYDISGPIEEIHVTLDRTVETSITFNHNDHERATDYPSPPIAEIVSITDGDILGNTNVFENISESLAYGNSVTGWANINYTDGILHIRGKTYDPKPYGVVTDIHVWVENSENDIIFSDWRYESKTYYEGEWVVGEETISGDPGATYYVTEDFDVEHLWASNGKLTGPDDIIEALSQGCGFAFFSGHGSPNVWTDHYPGIPGGRGYGSIPSFKVSNIKIYPKFVQLPIFPMKKLTNTNKPPVVIVGGCHNSQFNVTMIPAMLDIYNKKNTWCHGTAVPECFSWYLVKLPKTGAIASIGNTGLGYGVLGEDCTREGLDGGIGIEFYKQYFQEGYHVLGETFKETQISYVSQFDLDFLDHAKSLTQWVLLGDPSLMIGGY
ncbi:MAG: peptidase C25 [Thermoplasmatales archaeon SG8-52-3]|nr:MAG: peptidase C25 [Thermoplasmatales archaeon SG8-52-3]